MFLYWAILIVLGVISALLILWVASASLAEGGAVDEPQRLDVQGPDDRRV